MVRILVRRNWIIWILTYFLNDDVPSWKPEREDVADVDGSRPLSRSGKIQLCLIVGGVDCTTAMEWSEYRWTAQLMIKDTRSYGAAARRREEKPRNAEVRRPQPRARAQESLG
jgi:hypothetical protein